MNQLSLELGRFNKVREIVSATIDVKADIARHEIAVMIEHQRRSLGQKYRWAEWRLGR